MVLFEIYVEHPFLVIKEFPLDESLSSFSIFLSTVISVTSREFSPFFRQPLFVQYLFNNHVSSSSTKCAEISSIPGRQLLPQEPASNFKKIGCFWTHTYNAFFFKFGKKFSMLSTFRQRKTKVRVLSTYIVFFLTDNAVTIVLQKQCKHSFTKEKMRTPLWA